MSLAIEIYKTSPHKADKPNSLRSICKLLKAGVAKEELIRAQDNYRAKVEEDQTERKFIIQSNNFFGEAQRWREFVNPEIEEDEKALRDFGKLQEEIKRKKGLGKAGEDQPS